MEIEEILQTEDLSQRINLLQKGRLNTAPDIEKIKKQLNVSEHDIFNYAKRPRKWIQGVAANPETNDPAIPGHWQEVARIGIAMQKIIVKRASSFLFGNDIKLTSTEDDDTIISTIEKIFKENKANSLNKRIARQLFSCQEVAEYWYTIKDEKTNRYGFDSDLKIRCSLFSPLFGDVLYPFFDSTTGDMVAFSRKYKSKDILTGEEITYFETWTDKTYQRFKNSGNSWTDDTPEGQSENKLGKIPVVYAYQEETEWNDVQVLIERLEWLLSHFGDTNDYHSSPKIFVKGQIQGWAKKGEAGAIIEGEQNADAKYLSWEQAPEAIRLEIDTLFRLIGTITQTPDFSQDGLKGLGNAISGESLKMMFFDAHLKVKDKMEIFDEYLQRRLNIIKTFIGLMSNNREFNKVEITASIIPYMVNDDNNSITNIVTAVSGGIMSKETGVGLNPLVENKGKEIELIKAEQESDSSNPQELDKLQNE